MRRFAPITAFVLLLALSGSILAQKKVDEKKELAELAKIEKAQQAAKAAYLKSPKDAKKKKAYVDATLVLANNTQASIALSSKDKYPKALRLFREAIKVDPKNKEAIQGRDTIESIYKSLGRPIPK